MSGWFTNPLGGYKKIQVAHHFGGIAGEPHRSACRLYRQVGPYYLEPVVDGVPLCKKCQKQLEKMAARGAAAVEA